MKELNIKLKIEFNSIKIYIDNCLHLYFNIEQLIGIQSWVMPNLGKYFIEYTFKDNIIICDYDSMEKFKEILRLLDETVRY